MKRSLYFIIGIVVFIVGYFILNSFFGGEEKEQLERAHENYQKGEQAKTLGERSDAFNEALREYLALEEKHQPRFGNGKLFYNIGNTYFQLNQYPLAILYYYKAKALMPRNEKVQNNLKVAQEKLGIVEKQDSFFLDPLYSWITWTSFPEKIQLFSGLTMATFLFASLSIWIQRGWLKRTAIFLGILAGLMLVGFVFGHYFGSIEGVVVKSASLYRDAGFQYAKVQQEPLLSGIKVEILGLAEEGKWVKIMTPKGTLGYVPQEILRIL